jgi:hypothetical protein
MNTVDHKISAVIKTTGEIVEYSFKDADELAEAYKDVEARLIAYREIKNIMLNTSMQLITRRKGKHES